MEGETPNPVTGKYIYSLQLILTKWWKKFNLLIKNGSSQMTRNFGYLQANALAGGEKGVLPI